MSSVNFALLAERFCEPGVQAIALMGSHARGDAGPFSDIDLVRFWSTNDLPQTATHLIADHFVVITNEGPQTAETWFTEPHKVVKSIRSVLDAQPLCDPKGLIATFQQRAASFVWDEQMQQRANEYASIQMVGWIEEAQKALEGLKRNDVGRLLNGKHGLSWGLLDVVFVQRGIMIGSDNTIYEAVTSAMGQASQWTRLSRQAFGIDRLSLIDEVKAGLELYILTAQMLDHIFTAQDRVMIREVVRRIKGELG
ncbi:MAG: hypothetical protein GFH27_549281n160 [Chloroflexi bacterium AL-W]|nr:hypothetical protein [Chloroflexi bacterium AL-N1]NOK66046.1 hypothetical protein [Chloroflexi bacterium AL-N10]NOK72927.1 hypothetical protein [Chloroflexi bacterium AL-N5]NOK79824.1 hypothetical protein [Chloroflexi bacterium AL-W]NOK88320.1 hypothetical protein [Chloroflexi bacterium AL-N15]